MQLAMLSSRLAIRDAVGRTRFPRRVALPLLALFPLTTRSIRAASSDTPGPKKPDTFPSMPSNTAASAADPASITATLFPSEGADEQEQSPELTAIQNRLDGPHSCLKPGSPWGYAVFRTIYGPGTDAPWQRILELLEESVRNTCKFYPNARELLQRHVLTPIDDAAHLDGVSSHEVRDAFTEWAAAEMKTWTTQSDMPDVFCGTRYNFCLYFDAVCLESLEHKHPQPVVKLLSKHALSLGPDERNYKIQPGWEDGVTDEEEEDVGWMYIDLIGYIETYGQLDDPDWWHELRVRAPCPHPIFAGPRRTDDVDSP